jgi:hypothetical protein
MDLESNLRVISSRAYEARNKTLWWDRVAKVKDSRSKREVLAWLLDSAKINVETTEGVVEFEDAVIRTTEFEHKFGTAGLELFESQFSDLDGNGIDIATQWANKMGAEFSYFPQRVLAQAINANPSAYDGQSYFSATHPVSGKAGDTSLGTYSNLIAAKPIGGATTLDDAFKNLGSAIAAARKIKAPDGSPRALRPAALLVPGELGMRATQLLGAKFIGSTGSSDVEAVVSAWGLGQPLIADELGADFGGSDSSYYLVMTEAANDDLGAWAYSIREPFAIRYPSLTDSLYQESSKLRWVTKGRNAIVPGHPFLMVKVTAA